MFLQKRLGGRAPPQLGWEGGGGGEEPQAAGYRRSRRSAAGASRLHSDVLAKRGGARRGLRADRARGPRSSGFRVCQGSSAARGSERTPDEMHTAPRSGRKTLSL